MLKTYVAYTNHGKDKQKAEKAENNPLPVAGKSGKGNKKSVQVLFLPIMTRFTFHRKERQKCREQKNRVEKSKEDRCRNHDTKVGNRCDFRRHKGYQSTGCCQ